MKAQILVLAKELMKIRVVKVKYGKSQLRSYADGLNGICRSDVVVVKVFSEILKVLTGKNMICCNWFKISCLILVISAGNFKPPKCRRT